MEKTDPTGFAKGLATIPKGQLSERQQRIANGLAMIQGGQSIKGAARACGIPMSTLWGYARGVSDLSRENDGGRGRDLDAILDASIDVSLIAAERLRESLVNDEWKAGDLVKAYGVATDKVALLNQRSTDAPSGIRELFAAVLAEGDVTIRKRDPADEAIDVAADRVGGEWGGD